MPSPIPKTILRSPKVALTLTAVLLLVLAPIIAVVIYQRQAVASQKINYSQLYALAESSTAAALVTIEGDVLTVQARDGSILQATVTSEIARQGVVELSGNNVPIEFQALRPGPLATIFNWSIQFLPWAWVVSSDGAFIAV